jgi:hypothetical protein
MPFKNGLSERLDELRFPSPRSPPADAPFAAYTPLSPQGNLMSALQRPSPDVRANLQRRFTTDAASKLSSWTFVNQQQPAQSAESIDMVSSVSFLSLPRLPCSVTAVPRPGRRTSRDLCPISICFRNNPWELPLPRDLGPRPKVAHWLTALLTGDPYSQVPASKFQSYIHIYISI